MLLLGSRSDVEVYRCRASLAEAPHYQAYLAKANALRERHRDLLYRGVFCADCCHTLDNPDVQSNAFRLGDRLAVLLTQSDRDVRKPASRFRAMSAWSWIRFPAMSPWKAIPSFFRAMPLRW